MRGTRFGQLAFALGRTANGVKEATMQLQCLVKLLLPCFSGCLKPMELQPEESTNEI